MPIVIRLLRPVLRVALPVAVATVLVCLAIINVVLVKTVHGESEGGVSWPLEPHGLYYSLALVGVLALVVGSSVRLRRPNDPATLHFFWLTVAFSGVLAFTPVGRFDRLDAFLDWADAVARLSLPPIFLHFALVFPERAHPWIRTRAGRLAEPLFYAPAVGLGLWRVFVAAHGLRTPDVAQIDSLNLIYTAICLLAGLALMVRALTRLRSVTARRQLRWIIWGSTVGAVPFAALYLTPLVVGHAAPLAEYSAVLLGCIPLAFASALVRYRLMDIEVILKKVLAVAAALLLLVLIYVGTLEGIAFVAGADEGTNRFWALFATLVVALLAPPLWRAIQAAMDRLYYRDRYDYRRALVVFARDLNSDLDLDRLSSHLVTRIHDTLAVDRLALYLAGPRDDSGDFTAVASAGFGDLASPPPIGRSTVLGGRLAAGHTAVIDDPSLHRRIAAEDAALWRDAGLYQFVPCVSTNVTIAVIAVGRRAHGEPLSSEDMTLLGAVASQAATALENARLYGQLRMKADEIDQLRQFSDSVVESLSDGLVVVDLEDRVLRWNRRVEALTQIGRADAVGRPLDASFARPFVEAIQSARRESPGGAALYRVPLSPGPPGSTPRLLNTGVAPFQTVDGSQAGWIIVMEDVTDRANLEEQLRLSEKMAAIGLLAAGVAHEVNTPLTGISSFTQMLLDRANPADPNTQLLEKIERQTFRAAKIVKSLLNLARPSGGEVGDVDLNMVIADVLSLLEHQLRMSHIQVRKEWDPAPLVVSGIEFKIQQIFLNLFLNARDAMPKGGWLSVVTHRDGPDAIVDVSDTGVGIPAEHLARIYDPFFTTKPEGRGTGLGLSVTYGIVQEHHGTLTCTSDVGQGTRFRLVLPLEHPSAAVAGEHP
jgi:PAS domain S-box-containing protein